MVRSTVIAEVVSISTNLEKAHKEGACAKVELDAVHEIAQPNAKELTVASAMVHHERHKVAKAWQPSISRSEVTIANGCDET